MNPKPISFRPSGSRRDRTNRRQYHSCDRCRKGRRGCDAVHLGIDPFGSGQNKRRGCSACQKFNKECTFEWLRSIPQQALPRRLNPKPKVSEQRLQDEPGFDVVFAGADISTTYHAQQIERTDNETNLQDELDQNMGVDPLRLSEDGFPLKFDHQLGSLLRPPSSGHITEDLFFGPAYDFTSPKQFSQSVFIRDRLHGVEVTGKNNELAVQIQDRDSTGQIYRDSDHDQTLETPLAEEAHSSRQFGLDMPMPSVDGTQETSSANQSDLLGSAHRQNDVQDLVLGWYPTSTSPSSGTVDAPPLQNCVATQHSTMVSMQEHQLADRSAKITISNDLMEIYCSSLENAIQCWIDTETCPYRIETDVGLSPYTLNERTSSWSISNTLYDRVYKLDTAFERQRHRPLTSAEQAGSSKALKLAIMAFASQWSYSSRSSSTGIHKRTRPLRNDRYAVEPRRNSDFEVSGSHDFERLLRLSLWHESQRCIRRWRYCGSFRVILAFIVLFCNQQPVDEDELDSSPEYNPEALLVSQDLRPGASVPSNLDWFDNQLNSKAISSDTRTQVLANKSAPYFAPLSSSFCGQEGVQDLETGLRHLLTWRRLISSRLFKQDGTLQTATETPSTSKELPAPQYISDFNLLFWLGIMCDTTSSVLNQRPLVIPDSETLTNPSAGTFDLDSITNTCRATQRSSEDEENLKGMTKSVDIWGSYLLDTDQTRRRSTGAENLSTSQFESKTIQQAVPLKVLFWRKVGKLQNMALNEPTSSPAEVENTIKESLTVHQYWTTNYGEFFTACIREHSNLSVQSQSWYPDLVLGWNMGCLLLARYIDLFDSKSRSEKLGKALRASSALTSELRKVSAYAIAEAGRVSCLPPTSAETSSLATNNISFNNQSAILSDPHTEKVVKAIVVAGEVLLDWLRQWRSPAEGDSVLHLSWLYSNTSSEEISRHCVSCINALDLLRSKSDNARLSFEQLALRYNLLNGSEMNTPL